MDKVVPYNKSRVLNQYSDVFHGIGLFSGQCTFQVDPNVRPVVNSPRKVPVALRDKLDVIIKPVSGKLRVCLDPTELNKAIMRPYYPRRTLDDILPQVSEAKY